MVVLDQNGGDDDDDDDDDDDNRCRCGRLSLVVMGGIWWVMTKADDKSVCAMCSKIRSDVTVCGFLEVSFVSFSWQW